MLILINFVDKSPTLSTKNFFCRQIFGRLKNLLVDQKFVEIFFRKVDNCLVDKNFFSRQNFCREKIKKSRQIFVDYAFFFVDNYFFCRQKVDKVEKSMIESTKVANLSEI